MHITLKRGQKGALVGQNGSGKSWLAKYVLLPQKGPLLITDPKHSFEFHDCEIYESLRELKKRKPLRAIFRPSRHDLRDRDARDEIFDYAFDRALRGHELFLYNDELTSFISGPEPTPGLLDCITRGRELGLTMLNCSQRPSRVPIVVWSESQKFYIFRLVYPDDIKRIQALLGREHYDGRPPGPEELEAFRETYGYKADGRFAFTYWDNTTDVPPRQMIMRKPRNA